MLVVEHDDGLPCETACLCDLVAACARCCACLLQRHRIRKSALPMLKPPRLGVSPRLARKLIENVTQSIASCRTPDKSHRLRRRLIEKALRALHVAWRVCSAPTTSICRTERFRTKLTASIGPSEGERCSSEREAEVEIVPSAMSKPYVGETLAFLPSSIIINHDDSQAMRLVAG